MTRCRVATRRLRNADLHYLAGNQLSYLGDIIHDHTRLGISELVEFCDFFQGFATRSADDGKTRKLKIKPS